MNVWKALALGFAIGLVIALVPACSSSSCSAANCAGCCTSGNQCVALASETATQCGAAGNKCEACTGSQVCTSGVCTGSTCTGNNCNNSCGPSSCPNGCCTTQGLCLSGSGVQGEANCGAAGATCQPCNSPSNCQVGATGGVCVAGGPDAGPQGGVGSPCNTNNDCNAAMFLDAGATCLFTTADGGATYANGYCTILNCGSGNGGAGTCPGDSRCWAMGGIAIEQGQPAFDFYGENRTMCLAGCVSDFDCNIPQYTCFGGNNLNAARDDFNPAEPGLGCFISEPANPGEIGTPCNPTDESTAAFELCALPPTNGGCYSFTLADGGNTPGFCQADCLAALGDSTPDLWCGDGGTCLVTGGENSAGFPIQALCFQKCNTPDAGQGNCGNGAICWGGVTFPDGGPADFGFCQPSCQEQGGCNAGFTCTDAGYCQ
jgi:hypothetical protein